uniref:Yippee domain-containing protein n=1 Tax=Felis catus TaxID=9685 RepID=A0ABI7ZSP4_FELCA
MPSCDPGPGPACLPAKTFRSYLPRCHRTYSCVHCRAHLAKHDELISKVRQAGGAPPLSPAGSHQDCPNSPGGETTMPTRPLSCPWGTQAVGPRASRQSPSVLCLHSLSKGAMAEPTCLTPCESTSLFVCMCVCACLNDFPVWEREVSHPQVAWRLLLWQRGPETQCAVLPWSMWAELEREGPGTSHERVDCCRQAFQLGRAQRSPDGSSFGLFGG